MNPLMKLGVAGHVKLYRSTKGRRGGQIQGMQVLLITTVGRKSGEARTVPLVCIEHEGKRVIAASVGGAPNHPAWFLNMEANPAVTVELGEDQYEAVARVTEGDERALLWDKMVEAGKFFAGYQLKTSRLIPVIVLEPAAR